MRWGWEDRHVNSLPCSPDEDTPPPLWHAIVCGLENALFDLVSHADEGRNQEAQQIAVRERKNPGNVLKEYNVWVEVLDIVQKHSHHHVLLVIQWMGKVTETIVDANALARWTTNKHRNLTPFGEVPFQHGTAVEPFNAFLVAETAQRHPRVFLHGVSLPVYKVMVFSLCDFHSKHFAHFKEFLFLFILFWFGSLSFCFWR